ncbi:M56 family metallopeptidase [Aphanothece sacrum]|nr:M56 family metallopeptidase [Aphanothece sacrum]
MHLLMISIALFLALIIRLLVPVSIISSQNRWRRSLLYFVVPPLLLLMTVVAVISMGYHGQMLGWQASWSSYLLTLGFLSFAIIKGIQLSYQGWCSIQNIRHYPQGIIEGKKARILDFSFPYSAQIGFWKPELVISQGLLNTLDKDHVNAVIAHEEAHANYKDTFWFFWLGWLRSITSWLPKTESLWEDLLLLREIRADRQATQQVDPLILAESLLIVSQKIHQISALNTPDFFAAAFHDKIDSDRLKERIDALFDESETLSYNQFDWSMILLTLLPLVSIPFHC